MIEIPEQSIEQLEFDNVNDLLECIEKNFDRTVKIRKKILKIDESVLPRGNFLYILEYIGAVSYKKKYIYTLLSVIRKDRYAKLDLYENDKYKIVNRNISKQDDRKIYQMDWGKEVWFYNIDQVLKEIDNEEIIS